VSSNDGGGGVVDVLADGSIDVEDLRHADAKPEDAGAEVDNARLDAEDANDDGASPSSTAAVVVVVALVLLCCDGVAIVVARRRRTRYWSYGSTSG
jgi:hypothetical protein